MARYRVTINLNPISYEIEADNEEKAIEYAQECYYDETLYDLVKWATFSTEEQEGEGKK
jgi:hypothetical protein